MKEILEFDDIKKLVDSFYAKVKEDALLGPVFNKVLENKWSEHLPKMYRFWQTVLLKEYTYKGSPFLPHADLPVEKEHFHRWLNLFHETLDTHFTGIKAKEAKWRAEKMAEMFYMKILYHRNNSTSPLI